MAGNTVRGLSVATRSRESLAVAERRQIRVAL